MSVQHQNSKQIAIWILVVAIIAATLLIAASYIVPLAWAMLVTISIWPLYQHWCYKVCAGRHALAAFSLTFIIAIIVLAPLSWLAVSLTQELFQISHVLMNHSSNVMTLPHWLTQLQGLGNELDLWWQHTFNKPTLLKEVGHWLTQHVSAFSGYAKILGAKTAKSIVSLFICLLSIFFFLRDGEKLALQVQRIGAFLWPRVWKQYSHKIPAAIRGVVNGTVLSGLMVGVLLGVSYAIVGVPFPVFLGLATALLAMIPFGSVIALVVVVLTLLVKHAFISALVILIWGSLVAFATDHFVKPALIGGSVRLPFLMILIGILGGAKTLGLIGLFLGPVIMMLFYLLFADLQKT